jgi:hypothetical protein
MWESMIFLAALVVAYVATQYNPVSFHCSKRTRSVYDERGYDDASFGVVDTVMDFGDNSFE